MSQPVDLTNLRSMIDGDQEMEAILFEEFNLSFVEGISVLSQSLYPEHAQIWRSKSHALKGIALNLGAEGLSTLCKQAQEQYELEASDKEKLLQAIHKEYEKVRDYLAVVASHR